MSADGPEFNPVMQPDEPLTPFDVTKTSERAGLLKLVIGFGLLLVLAFIVLKLYQPGVRDRGDPPLITAENTPFKIVPEDAGGMQTPDQDKEVFDVMSGNSPSTDVITLPPPEQPLEIPQSPQEKAAQPVPDPVSIAPDPVVQQPATRPVVTPPSTPTPRQPAAGNSEWIVQVASLRSQAEAEATYAAIRSKNTGILSSYRSDIVRVDLAEKGIYYRARVAGFSSRADANTTCDRLKAPASRVSSRGDRMGEIAAILGLSGPRLTPNEKAFFRDADPWGFILFSRNVDAPDQIRRLCGDLRNAVSREALIFVDQEGGRVQRLKAPHWRAYPTGATYASLYNDDEAVGKRAVFLGHRLIADDLRAVGITADCAPVLDLPQPGSDPIISDRALGDRTDQIVDLARAAMSGLTQGGVAPVIKHIPGHGRATVDSHLSLPRIDTSRALLERTDFVPFRELADAPMAMTAHAVYTVVDDEPVTTSATALKDLIRDTIGFEGLLMSDDLDMKALAGDSLVTKTEAALSAGCDIALQCSGQLPDMINLAKGCRPLIGKALERARAAENSTMFAETFDRAEAEAEFDDILSPFV